MSDTREKELVDQNHSSIRINLHRMAARWQRFLVPGLENSQYAYRKVLYRLVSADTDWLDVGCGHQLMPDWMPRSDQHAAAIIDAARSVTGIDGDESSIRRHQHIVRKVVGDGHRLPFKNCSFDLVTANVVVEHIADPAELLAEVHRVLRPGGKFAFHTPNLLGYGSVLAVLLPQSLKNKLAALLQGRCEEDVYPTFYRMNTRRKIEDYARRFRFTVADLSMVESSAQTYMFGPLVLLELLWIRGLRSQILQNYRTNVIAILKKDSESQPSGIVERPLNCAGLHESAAEVHQAVVEP